MSPMQAAALAALSFLLASASCARQAPGDPATRSMQRIGPGSIAKFGAMHTAGCACHGACNRVARPRRAHFPRKQTHRAGQRAIRRAVFSLIYALIPQMG